MPILRPYQQQIIDDTHASWEAGHRNVLVQAPCRSGKTVTFSAMNNDNVMSCTIVHRQELVGQISKTYAQTGIMHNIIAPQPVINFCIAQMIKEVGRSFYDPKAPAHVAGVDTLIRRYSQGDRWSNSIRRWTGDECHHFRQENKWGKAVDLFPNANGLGVTATPIRADNKSLHADQGGVFHDLIQVIGMRELIEQGNVCDYRVIAPKPSINEALLKIGSAGEFTDKSKKEATRAEIVGDIVQTYLLHVPGKQAIVFASDVKQSNDIAKQFCDAGIKAAALDGTTNDSERQKTVDQFAMCQLQVLVNVDLFGEGFDVPACEVVIMARPTMSFGLFVQQFCRPLTPAPGKKFGIIIDHVGNVLRMAATHGMPDTQRRWQLWKDEGARGVLRNPDAIPMRSCLCGLAYPALDTVCPYCGLAWVPEGRDAPKQVDGILSEMSPELLAQLRAAKAQVWVDQPAIPYGATDVVRAGIHGRHVRTQMAHLALAEAMEFWGGVRRVEGDTDTQMQARFLHRFGVDVMTAQTLPASKALELRDAIRETLA